MKEQVLEILQKLRPEVDFGKETKLIDDGVLDSFDLIMLIGEINEAFGVEVDFGDMEPEYFNSVDAMVKLIGDLQKEEHDDH